MKLFWRLLATGLWTAMLFWTAAVVAYELVYNPHGATTSAFYFR